MTTRQSDYIRRLREAAPEAAGFLNNACRQLLDDVDHAEGGAVRAEDYAWHVVKTMIARKLVEDDGSGWIRRVK